MADIDSKFDVVITLSIRDATTGEPTPFSRTIQEFSGLTYEKMQELQTGAVGALFALFGEEGNRVAEEIKGKRGQGKDKTDEKFAR